VTKVLIAVLAAVGAGLSAAVAGSWLALGASPPMTQCQADAEGSAVPPELVPIFVGAASRYELGADGPGILAGLTKVESGFGRDLGPSSAGAVGWTQFLPSTWAAYGVDADGDGRRDPSSAEDAIHAAARYLQALGAPADWRKALYGYNHAWWYVEKVLRTARELRLEAGCDAPLEQLGGRLVGGGRIVEIPWQPGEWIDERLLADLDLLRRRFRIAITDGYTTSGHSAAGEHPLGLGVDIVPGPSGSWDDIDGLATWAEPEPGKPRSPFRWVGYDGDSNHGRGHHLHLSWRHGGAPDHRPPARWVDVLGAER
jgi:hypothetical protein